MPNVPRHGTARAKRAYANYLCYKFSKIEINYEKQKGLPIIYKDVTLDCGYRIDILVENKIVIELKTVEKLLPIHTAQIMTYLKLSNKHLGLLFNFYNANLQNVIKRYVL